MAAVTAELIDAPGVALVSLADGLAPVVDGAAHATRDRAAVIVISDGAADSRLLEPVVKASAVADGASAGHWIAHAAQAAMADPRGAVHLAVPPGVADAPAVPRSSVRSRSSSRSWRRGCVAAHAPTGTWPRSIVSSAGSGSRLPQGPGSRGAVWSSSRAR